MGDGQHGPPRSEHDQRCDETGPRDLFTGQERPVDTDGEDRYGQRHGQASPAEARPDAIADQAEQRIGHDVEKPSDHDDRTYGCQPEPELRVQRWQERDEGHSERTTDQRGRSKGDEASRRQRLGAHQAKVNWASARRPIKSPPNASQCASSKRFATLSPTLHCWLIR